MYPQSLTVCDEEYCIQIFNTSHSFTKHCGYAIYKSNNSNPDTDTLHLNTLSIWIIIVLSVLLVTIIIVLIIITLHQQKYKNQSIIHSKSKPEISISRLRPSEKSSNYQYAAIPGVVGSQTHEEPTCTDEEAAEALIDRAFSTKKPKIIIPPIKSRNSKRLIKVQPTIKISDHDQNGHETDATDSPGSEYLAVDVKTLRRHRYSDSAYELTNLSDFGRLDSRHLTDRTQDDMIFVDDPGSITPITADDFTRISTWRVIKMFSPQEIKYCGIDFKNEKFIGKGSMGKVYKAKYDGVDVAVKKVNMKYLNLSGNDLKNFKREAAMMQKVGGHKHIARMYGFCTEPEICIVTEYYSRGSIHDIMKNNKANYLSVQLKIQMSIEASLGVLHLHQQNVIHRDLSARNLLVDANWIVVVSDLGMSRLKRNNVNNQNRKKDAFGAVKWMAPECITRHEYSEKTDSYSFGITLFEIFSECEPYKGIAPLEAGAKVVHEGLRPQINRVKYIKSMPDLGQLMTRLWNSKPKERPDFHRIGECLKKVKSKVS
eukprot:184999_1